MLDFRGHLDHVGLGRWIAVDLPKRTNFYLAWSKRQADVHASKVFMGRSSNLVMAVTMERVSELEPHCSPDWTRSPRTLRKYQSGASSCSGSNFGARGPAQVE